MDHLSGLVYLYVKTGKEGGSRGRREGAEEGESVGEVHYTVKSRYNKHSCYDILDKANVHLWSLRGSHKTVQTCTA